MKIKIYNNAKKLGLSVQEIEEATEFALNVLDLENFTATLHIYIENPILHHDGDVIFDGCDEFELRLFTHDLATLFHELTHVMQYAFYELEIYAEGHAYWKDCVVEGFCYDNSPWEVEARRFEGLLMKAYKLYKSQQSCGKSRCLRSKLPNNRIVTGGQNGIR